MAGGPVSRTHIASSMSDCMSAPGMSHVVTSIFYFESMTQDSNMDSVVVVGEILSSFIL